MTARTAALNWPSFTIGLFALIVPSVAHAQAGQWQVITQPGGYRVARVTSQGAMTGLALICERNVPVLAISLAQTPARNPAPVTITIEGASTQMALVRNRNTDVWVAGVRDRRLLDMLTNGSSARVSIGGIVYGTVSLAGSTVAIQSALAGCYAPRPSAPTVAGNAANPFSLPIREGVYIDVDDYFAQMGDPQPQSCSRFRQTITFDGKSFVHRFYGGEHRGAVWTRTITRVTGRAGNRVRVAETFDDSAEKYLPEVAEIQLTDMWQVGDTLHWRNADPNFVPPTIRLKFCPDISPAMAAGAPLEPLPASKAAEGIAGSQPMQPGMTDEEAIRSDIARIYGYRDGRKSRGEADGGEGHLSPRLEALLAACTDAAEAAGTAKDGSGAYDILGDQGCEGDVFGLDERVSDADAIPRLRVTLKALPDAGYDAKLSPMNSTFRYRKYGNRWMIDEVSFVNEGKTSTFSDELRTRTSEILKLPRKRRKPGA